MTVSDGAEGADLDDRTIKAAHAANFDALNEQVAGNAFDKHVRFFNFGYVAVDDEPLAGPTLGPNFPNRESAQLLFEVVGDVDLTGKRVAEIGCGRGGNLWTTSRYLGAAHVVGLDIAFRSVSFATQSRTKGPSSFVQGDAEVLPFASASMDAVLSVETSCTYPDIERFYREVVRILKPGGWFLYTDLMPGILVDPVRQGLPKLGLELMAERNISANVAASREQRAERQKLAFGDTEDKLSFDEWVGEEGSELNASLRDGSNAYQIFRFRKLEGVDPDPAPLLDEASRVAVRQGSRHAVDLLTIRAAPAAS